jgi:hypothetical protein
MAEFFIPIKIMINYLKKNFFELEQKLAGTLINGTRSGATNAQLRMDKSSMEIKNIEITRPNENSAAVSKGQQVVER